MATPFPFTSGQVLTAAQLNAITELPVNDKTASYTLVAGDAGERVIMNSASATTITVNTSIFTAGQLVYITNKGAGICTVTAGTATVSTTGSLALAQFASGVLYCISAGVFLFEAYGVSPTASGLAFINTTSFTTATSVSLPANTFSSTYTNYRVLFALTAVTTTGNITGRFRTAGTDNTSARYFQMSVGINIAATASNQVDSGTSSFTLGTQGTLALPFYSLVLDFFRPNQSGIPKNISGSLVFFDGTSNYIGRAINGVFDNNSVAFQADSFSFISSAASSMTGTVQAYGYSLT